MTKPRILFIPDQFTDYRMWSDIPDRTAERAELEESLTPFVPAVEVVRDPEATLDRFREVILQVYRDIAVPDIPADQLGLMLAMHSDHAEEYFLQLRKLAKASDSQVRQPDPPWMEHPWIDRLEDLDAPVTAAVKAKGIEVGNAIARRAEDAEVVVISEGWVGLAPVADRIKAAGILLEMLDRVGLV